MKADEEVADEMRIGAAVQGNNLNLPPNDDFTTEANRHVDAANLKSLASQSHNGKASSNQLAKADDGRIQLKQ